MSERVGKMRRASVTANDFWSDVRAIWAGARSQSRDYLTFPEWERFFAAAIKRGLFSAEKAEEVLSMDMTRENHRVSATDGNFWSRLVGEQFRLVSERKAAGDTAWQASLWMRRRVDRFEAESSRKASEMAAFQAEQQKRAEDAARGRGRGARREEAVL